MEEFRIVTVDQMQSIDRDAIGGDTERGFVFMQKAGDGVYKTVSSLIPDPDSGDIAVVCGKGNNGGDGYYAAKLLLDAGYGVMCYGISDETGLKQEALRSYKEFIEANGNYLLLDDVADINLSGYALVVDALLGTGMRGDPHGLIAEIIQAINTSNVPVVAVDTPSGLNTTTGIPGVPCIKAVSTVTMGFPKLGMFFYPAREHTGRVLIEKLGYPEQIVKQHHGHVYLPLPERFPSLVPPRKPAGSKIDHGLTAMLCGSRGMTGAAALAAESALRSGCGMVHLMTPVSVVPVLASTLREAVIHPIGETEYGTPSSGAYDEIIDISKNMQCLCIGPGTSHEKETVSLIQQLILTAILPIVLDADGLNAFKGCIGKLSERRCPHLVLTPHRGEYERLFGPIPDTPESLIHHIMSMAQRYNVTICYKGNPTIIASPDSRINIMPYGTSVLATAGSGDVLTGIIASLIAQGSDPADAVLLGTWLQSKAGTTAARHLGEHSVIAGDLVRFLPDAFLSLHDTSASSPTIIQLGQAHRYPFVSRQDANT